MRSLTLFFSAILLLGTACQGLLDVAPQDQISNEEALSSPEGIQAAMAGAYSTLGESGYYLRAMVAYPELAGHLAPNPDAVSSGDFSGNLATPIVDLRDAHFFALQPTYEDSSLDEFYRVLYILLGRVNNILEALPAVEGLTEAERNSLQGEALALRALAHFDLLRLYAQPYRFTPNAAHPGVVLLDAPLPVTARPARSTVAEGFSLVEADLLQAISLLNSFAQRTTEAVWLTPTAARGLLARVYAYRENWEGVVEQASRVIESGGLALLNPGEYVDTWAQQLPSPEAIWYVDLQRHRNADPSSTGLIFSMARVAGVPEDLEVVPYARVSNDLLSLYGEEDLRRELFIEIGGQAYCRKYSLRPNYVSNFPILRLSELFLLRAEAYAALGQDALAQADYNLIHQRAVDDAPAIGLTGQALRDEIFKERRRELALEGHLLFDLARTGRGVERQDCLPGNLNCSLPFPDFRFVLPIPQSALNANPNLTQNEGY